MGMTREKSVTLHREVLWQIVLTCGHTLVFGQHTPKRGEVVWCARCARYQYRSKIGAVKVLRTAAGFVKIGATHRVNGTRANRKGPDQ